MKIKLVITFGALIAAGIAVAADSLKPSPAVERVRKKYQQAVDKAEADYNAAAMKAFESYRQDLQAAQKSATAEKRSADVIATAGLLKEIDAETPPRFVAGALHSSSPKAWAGTWRIKYFPNNIIRTYVIGADGRVRFLEENMTATLQQRGQLYALDFGDGKLEQISFSTDRIFVEHYSPKTADWGNLHQVGVGTRNR